MNWREINELIENPRKNDSKKPKKKKKKSGAKVIHERLDGIEKRISALEKR